MTLILTQICHCLKGAGSSAVSIDRDSVVAELYGHFSFIRPVQCRRTCTLIAILTQLHCFLLLSEMAMGNFTLGKIQLIDITHLRQTWSGFKLEFIRISILCTNQFLQFRKNIDAISINHRICTALCPLYATWKRLNVFFGALSQSSSDIFVFVVIWHCSQWDSSNLPSSSPFPLSPILVPSVYYSM